MAGGGEGVWGGEVVRERGGGGDGQSVGHGGEGKWGKDGMRGRHHLVFLIAAGQTPSVAVKSSSAISQQSIVKSEILLAGPQSMFSFRFGSLCASEKYPDVFHKHVSSE